MWVCAWECRCLQKSHMSDQIPALGWSHKWLWKAQHGQWDPNPGPLQVCYSVSTTELSFQTHFSESLNTKIEKEQCYCSLSLVLTWHARIRPVLSTARLTTLSLPSRIMEPAFLQDRMRYRGSKWTWGLNVYSVKLLKRHELNIYRWQNVPKMKMVNLKSALSCPTNSVQPKKQNGLHLLQMLHPPQECHPLFQVCPVF